MTTTIEKPEETSKDMNLVMRSLIQMGPALLKNKPLIKMAMTMGENYLKNDNKRRHKEDKTTPPGVIDDETAMSLAILLGKKYFAIWAYLPRHF